RFRRPSLPHCGQGAFLGPQGIGITTTVGASVPMLASLVRGGLSTTTFHQGACPNVQAPNGFQPPTIRWGTSRSLLFLWVITIWADIGICLTVGFRAPACEQRHSRQCYR